MALFSCQERLTSNGTHTYQIVSPSQVATLWSTIYLIPNERVAPNKRRTLSEGVIFYIIASGLLFRSSIFYFSMLSSAFHRLNQRHVSHTFVLNRMWQHHKRVLFVLRTDMLSALGLGWVRIISQLCILTLPLTGHYHAPASSGSNYICRG